MSTSFHQMLAILNQWLLAGLVYLFSGVGEVDGPERRRRGDVALRVIVVCVVVYVRATAAVHRKLYFSLSIFFRLAGYGFDPDQHICPT